MKYELEYTVRFYGMTRTTTVTESLSNFSLLMIDHPAMFTGISKLKAGEKFTLLHTIHLTITVTAKGD